MPMPPSRYHFLLLSLFSLATNNIICIESYKITIIILIKTSDIYTTHSYSFKDNANQPASQPVPHSLLPPISASAYLNYLTFNESFPFLLQTHRLPYILIALRRIKENILSESILNWLNEVHLNQRMCGKKAEENIKLDYTCCGVGVGAGNTSG